MDKVTTFFSIESLFKTISGCEIDKFEVHLHGGDSDTRTQAAKIVGLVKSQKNSELVSANLCNGDDFKCLAIDSRTGKIFTIFSVRQLDYGDHYDLRIKHAASRIKESPLDLGFDGRNMIQKATLTSSLFSSSPQKNEETYCGIKPGFLYGNGL